MKVLGLGRVLLALAIAVGPLAAVAAERNSCGCYKSDTGTCYCDKKAKCGCPGECEPKGCAEARERQMQKEIDAETKKAAEASRRSSAAKTGDEEEAPASTREPARTSPKPSAEGEAAASKGKKLTPVQAKQLVKLLDLYFAEKPDARARSVEEVRNELAQSR